MMNRENRIRYQRYLDMRMSNHCWYADIPTSQFVNNMDGIINYNHPLLVLKPNASDYMDKGISDYYALKYWNIIFPSNYCCSSVSDLRSSALKFIHDMDRDFPNGEGCNERSLILYGLAHSVSSFIGIQKHNVSVKAHQSMISTLESHSSPKFYDREWLIPNLKYCFDYVNRYNLMDRKYSDIILVARASSSSVKGAGSFRDYVLENDFDDICKNVSNKRIPLLIYAGTRSDRRGKYRLIFSFDANFRVVDYLLNNGAYDLCENKLLSKYTTEGYNNKMMWDELVAMSDRRLGKTMVCLDYKGYDTQIKMEEYLSICIALNQYRRNYELYSDLIKWYIDWMKQPKPLVTRSSQGIDILITNCKTLASGLHGTHSHENLIGISTYLEALNRGIRVNRFWSNGDDQNTLLNRTDLDKYMKFIDDHFDVSWDKSLINHRLAVWGKLWFAREVHPFWEIGTLRSLWEREGGETSHVEKSKFQANYCKIIQTLIILIRLGKSPAEIEDWMCDICNEIGIDPYRIPYQLNELSVTTSGKIKRNEPKGLRSVKSELMSKTYRLIGLNARNYYDMINNMYRNQQFYNLEVKDVKYHAKGQDFVISRGKDFSRMVPNDVPWVYRDIYTGVEYSLEDKFNRDILQGTKSYDGPCHIDFRYNDMMSLAHAINDRNKLIWKYLVNK